MIDNQLFQHRTIVQFLNGYRNDWPLEARIRQP
jgi:hypothetical protein